MLTSQARQFFWIAYDKTLAFYIQGKTRWKGMKTQNKVDLSTLASYTHMKIALDGKVITNTFFSTLLIIKQTKSITVVSRHEKRTSRFFNNLRCSDDNGLLETSSITSVLLCVVTNGNIKDMKTKSTFGKDVFSLSFLSSDWLVLTLFVSWNWNVKTMC